jgi:N-acetylneuraminic acid mutarotase
MKSAIDRSSIPDGSDPVNRRAATLLLNQLVRLGVLVLPAFLCLSAHAQTNEWTWMGGSKAGAENQVTGTLGVPANGNIPGARYQATTWTDKSGNFWLFGGANDIDACDWADRVLNDLWEFNPSTNEWAWMAGSSTGCQPGVYGMLGKPSVQNVPGGREDASGWTDSKGNLWLFGGYGLDASGAWGVLNDLWEFNPSTGEWTWMSGSSTIGNSCFAYGNGGTVCAQPSIYGTSGTPAAGNTPGSREAAITWTDNKGDLWLFGGWSYDVSVQVQYYFDELWEYNPSTNQWAWMGGSNTRAGSACLWNVNLWYYTCGEPGVYGTIGTPAPGNIPGGRAGATRWTDSQGHLWLFSGSGFDVNGYFGDTNDLWEFNSSTVQWTWMGGNNAIPPCSDYDCSAPAVYGTLGTPAAGNIPVGRDHAVGWSDSNDNLWLFGGGGGEVPDDINNGGLTDLWEFNPSNNEWALMGGSIQAICGIYCSSNPEAVYGVLGVSAPGNGPGTRFAPAGWTDSSGNFWLFGGHPSPVEGGFIFDNDLWEYQPSNAALPTTATPTFSVPTGSYASAQSVTISDTTNGAFIYYTTDGTTPTINSLGFFPATSQPISIQHSETLKAIAVASGCLTSEVATATYTLPPQAATPTFSLLAGTYTSFQTVTISDTTPGTTIYYTTNGSTPTTSSSVYTGPITVTSSETLQAMAMANGYSISNIASAFYNLNLPQVANPVFSPQFGNVTTPLTVTISDATPGAIIYYQIGNYPTTSSPVYSSPITVSSPETIWAIAMASNYYQSDVVDGVYTLNSQAPQTATPTFSVPSGNYTTPQTVTISDTTNGAFIYYTTDWSTPTTSSNVYTGPITVSSSEMLQAIAMASGDTISAVAGAVYTITISTDFSVTVSPASLTITAGHNGTSIVTITPLNGFSSAVSFSCSGLLAGTSCSFSPATVTPASQAVSTTLEITTLSTASNRRPIPLGYTPVAVLALTLCFVRFRGCRRYTVWILCVAATLSLSCLSACGGVSPTSSTATPGPTATPESGTVTVTATSGSLSHSVPLTLSVN